MKKELVIGGGVIVFVILTLFFNSNQTPKDLRVDFVRQVKKLPNGDLTSTQCKKMYDDVSEKETLNFGFGSYKTVNDYTYVISKKMCVALISSNNKNIDNTTETVTIRDLGTNSDIYLYSYRYSRKEPSEVIMMMFGKEVSTSTLLPGHSMFFYLKDNLK